MAGSGKFKGQKELKNKAMLVVRNITQQEVTNVIFPNGITVGAITGPFRNGMRVHGNAQISGVVNAQGFKVNGEDLVASGQPFIFLDVNSYATAFDDSSDSSPTPSTIAITVTQQSQATTLQSSDITATDSAGNVLTITGFSVTASSVGNSTSTASLDVSGLGRSGFPVTITASNDGLTSTKTIVSVVGGDDGTPGSTPATPETLILDLNAYSANFDNSSDTSATPATVGITVTQSGQADTLVVGDISATSNGGSSGDLDGSISSFSNTESSTGNSVSTATLTLPSGQSGYPITVTASNDGLTSTKTIVKVAGGDDGTPGTSSDGYTVHLSNPSHSLFTTNAGAVTYTGSGTNIAVFKGASELNGILSGTPSTGEFSVTSVTASGITEGARTSPGNPIICAQGSNMTQNTASITYTLNLENLVTVQAIQSLTKSIEGTDGSTPSPPEFVNLTASSTVISYDADGLNPTPSSITLTADSQNFTDGYFKFTGGGAAFTDEGSYTDGASANQDTATFTPPASYSATPYTFTVGVADGDQSELASDSISIGSFKPGPDESIRTELFTLDLGQELGVVKTSANEGHYLAASSQRSASNPPPIGKLRDDVVIQLDAGAFPAGSLKTTLNTGFSPSVYCQAFSYRVPAGSTFNLKRVLGYIQFTGIPAADDYTIELHVYRTAGNANGTVTVDIEHLAQIDIDGSASAYHVRGTSTTTDPITVDTGALSGITVSAKYGIMFLLYIETITTIAGGLTACDGTLSMEYTLS